ncbi:hypothetical protein ABZ070_34770 [Streptomyces sp. NPDC006283]|uniref:hypothetical protein n=1 Tax=Streptomyces sp. NPDC006283 TaxID=3156741 RepID=UPI0033BC2F91
MRRSNPPGGSAEWDADTRPSSGDVDHTGTAVYRCDVAACDALTPTRQGLGATCEKTTAPAAWG